MSHHPARHPDDARAAPAATASKYAAPTGSAAAAVDMPFHPSASLVSAADADTAYGAHRLQVSARVARRLADPARLHVVHGRHVPLTSAAAAALYDRIDEKTGEPRGLKPEVVRCVRCGGFDPSWSVCWHVYTRLCHIMGSVSLSACFALAFFGFGVPLPLAVAFGVGFCLFLAPAHNIYTQILKSGYVYLYIDEELEASLTPSCKNVMSKVVVPVMTQAVMMGTLFWFGMAPLLQDDGALRTICLAVFTTGIVTNFLHPPYLAASLVVHAFLERLPIGRKILVDSYAHALIATIIDTDTDAKIRLKRIDVLFRNFMNEAQSSFGQGKKTTRRLPGTLIASQVGNLLAFLSASACVIVPVPGESEAERAGRVSVGLFCVLLFGVYIRSTILGAVTASQRWTEVVRMHLSDPKVTAKSLELGAWRTVPGFMAWLRDAHDLRREVCGVLVDVDDMVKILSVVGSGAAVVFGYGLLSLVGLR